MVRAEDGVDELVSAQGAEVVLELGYLQVEAAQLAPSCPLETSAPRMCLKVINSLGRNDEM